jgi:hypothetical protein
MGTGLIQILEMKYNQWYIIFGIVTHFIKSHSHRWFSGKISRCHRSRDLRTRLAPGSIPGRCIFCLFASVPASCCNSPYLLEAAVRCCAVLPFFSAAITTLSELQATAPPHLRHAPATRFALDSLPPFLFTPQRPATLLKRLHSLTMHVVPCFVLARPFPLLPRTVKVLSASP